MMANQAKDATEYLYSGNQKRPGTFLSSIETELFFLSLSNLDLFIWYSPPQVRDAGPPCYWDSSSNGSSLRNLHANIWATRMSNGQWSSHSQSVCLTEIRISRTNPYLWSSFFGAEFCSIFSSSHMSKLNFLTSRAWGTVLGPSGPCYGGNMVNCF